MPSEASRSQETQAPSAERAPSAVVERKVGELKAAFPDAQVLLDESQARVAGIERLRAPTAGSGPEDIVRSVLGTRAVGSALGLSPDLRELCSPVTRKDPQLAQRAVVRMSQCVSGVKVLGAELVMSVSVTPTPAIESLKSSLAPGVPGSATAAITAAAAAKTAASAAGEGTGGSPAGAGSRAVPELVYFVPSLFQMEGPGRLCWLVRVNSKVVLVDARSGVVAHLFSEPWDGK
jgi:hypothetical protein